MCSIVWLGILPILAFFAPIEENNARHFCGTPEVPILPAEDLANLSKVHVVYASDGNNFAGLLASMASLTQHLREPSNCSIHIIVNESLMARARVLTECFQRARPHHATPSVRLHALRPLPFDVAGADHEDWHGRRDLKGNVLKYLKFYLHEYLPEAPRAIWLDTDTVVRADLGPLYRMRMAHALAAAPEKGDLVSAMRQFVAGNAPELLPRLDGLHDSSYFNVGVLLLDLTRWRDEAAHVRAEAAVQRTAGLMVEQTALNQAFPAGSYDALDWRWNLVAMGMPVRASRWCVHRARVLHFTGGKFNSQKPWHPDAKKQANNYLYSPHLQACPA